jgi:hypothetical protein
MLEEIVLEMNTWVLSEESQTSMPVGTLFADAVLLDWVLRMSPPIH